MKLFHMKKKGLIAFLFFTSVGMFVIYNTLNSKRKSKSIYEFDVYGDGDYDEESKVEFIRKHGLMDYPIMEMNVKKATLKPPPPLKKIKVLESEEIHLLPSMPLATLEKNFFKYLETKDVVCEDDKRLGYQHDGGYNVCFSLPFGLRKPCIIYSFGIGDNWVFDDATSKIYGCKVYSFDPSIDKGDNYNRSALITFKKLGIGTKNGVNGLGWKIMTFDSILKMNNHYKKVIDYLKFDVEFNEWEILHTMTQDGSLMNVKQVGFEMHTNEIDRDKPSFRPTGKKEFLAMFQIMKNLEKLNFKKFNYRMNPFGEYKSNITGIKRSCCYEVHFLNMNFANPHNLRLN